MNFKNESLSFFESKAFLCLKYFKAIIVHSYKKQSKTSESPPTPIICSHLHDVTDQLFNQDEQVAQFICLVGFLHGLPS